VSGAWSADAGGWLVDAVLVLADFNVFDVNPVLTLVRVAASRLDFLVWAAVFSFPHLVHALELNFGTGQTV